MEELTAAIKIIFCSLFDFDDDALGLVAPRVVVVAEHYERPVDSRRPECTFNLLMGRNSFLTFNSLKPVAMDGGHHPS